MKDVDLSEYRPGHGYKVKKYLGSGAWKSAFRGSSEGTLDDVALLCYHSGSNEDAANDMKQLLRLNPETHYTEHLASFYLVFRGDDRRMWIAEELLAKALSQMVPLGDIVSLTRLARDLSKGLACIHQQNLVHRDVKLDNCGVDRFGRGKIFDLGSLVSDPGDIACTMLTRPPEILTSKTELYVASGDVWALGATLLALNTGDYPFVTGEEVTRRSSLNELIALAENEQERALAQQEKEAMDKTIAERAKKKDAEATLIARVQDSFGNGVGALLSGMLSFDPSRRKTSRELVDRWSVIAANFARPSSERSTTGGTPAESWERIARTLRLAAKREITVTSMQLERVALEWGKAKRSKIILARVGDLNELIEEVRAALAA